MAIRHHIGLEISEQSFQFVEVRIVDEAPLILHAERIRTSRDFSAQLLHEAPFHKDLAKAFISDMTSLCQRQNLLASAISVALPISACLVTTVPVDSRLSESERTEQFEWECRTLMSLSPDTKVRVLSQPMQKMDDGERHLLVAFPEATLVFLSSVLAHLTFTIQSIEPNHFVQENSILQHERLNAGSGFAVCGLFDSCCSVGVYENDCYRGFRSGIVSYKQQLSSTVLLHLENILNEHHNTRIDTLHLFGPSATEQMESTFRQLLHIEVRRCDLTTTVPFASQAGEAAALKEKPFTFDTALRAALRNAE